MKVWKCEKGEMLKCEKENMWKCGNVKKSENMKLWKCLGIQILSFSSDSQSNAFYQNFFKTSINLVFKLKV